MRLIALLVTALSLASVPAAVADQTVEAGPASLTTASMDSGDGCEAGDNGFAVRSLIVHVDDPRAPNSFKEIGVTNQCQAYANEWGSGHGSYLYAYAYSQEFGVPGPSAGYSWYGWSDEGGTRQCGSNVSLAGVAFQTGCPSPDGSSPPMLPALP